MDVRLRTVVEEFDCSCLTVRDAGLLGSDDGRVLAYARDRDLLLITHDKDFRRGRDFPIQNNPGSFVLAGTHGENAEHALRHVVDVVGDMRDHWRDTVVRVSDPNTWIVRSWVRDEGVVDHLRIRGFCEDTIEAIPMPGVKHVDVMLKRWTVLDPAT